MPRVVFLVTALWSEIIFIEERAGRIRKETLDMQNILSQNRNLCLMSNTNRNWGLFHIFAPDLLSMTKADEKILPRLRDKYILKKIIPTE